MLLEDLLPAVARTRDRLPDLRGSTYLPTYPGLIRFGSGKPDLSKLQSLALMTYGWMPTIVRLDAHYSSAALAILTKAQKAAPQEWQSIAIADLAGYLSSSIRRSHQASSLHKSTGVSYLGYKHREFSSASEDLRLSDEAVAELRRLRV
jgi:hypothetical protein